MSPHRDSASSPLSYGLPSSGFHFMNLARAPLRLRLSLLTEYSIIGPELRRSHIGCRWLAPTLPILPPQKVLSLLQLNLHLCRGSVLMVFFSLTFFRS